MVDGEDGKVPRRVRSCPVLLNRADDLLGPAITPTTRAVTAPS